MTAETTTPTAPVTDGVILTKGAADKVRALLDSEGRDDLSLRVAVQPGGCSGLWHPCRWTSGTSAGTSTPGRISPSSANET